MSNEAQEFFERQDKEQKSRRLANVARALKNDTMLHIALKQIDHWERKKVYDALVPLLPFKPLPFKKLMKAHPFRESDWIPMPPSWREN